jgi:HlyD family secretion protein
MKKSAVIGIAAAGVLALVLSAYFILVSGDRGTQYKIEKITRGDIEETVFASGTINAITTVSVGTQVSGRIKQVFVDYNSRVNQGQVIAQIDPSIFQTQVEQARASLMVAQANLQRADSALLDAKRSYDRYQELFKGKFLSKSDMDNTEANYNSARIQVIAAKAQVTQATAAVRYAEANLKYTDIVSPIDGVVIQRNIDVGQTVAATFQTPTLFQIAQDLTKMQIDTNVNEVDIGKIQVGQEVLFTVGAYPDLNFAGKVFQVRNAPNSPLGLAQAIQNQTVVNYDVVIKMDNPDLKLKPGMTASVTIITANKKGVLKIPNAALRFIPPEDVMAKAPQKGYGVWTLGRKKPVRVKITIGISDENYTELISGEIREGQEVIVELEEKNGKSGSGAHNRKIF